MSGAPPNNNNNNNNNNDSSDFDFEDEWIHHDGELLGEKWLDDKYHGTDTLDQMDVCGLGTCYPPHVVCSLVTSDTFLDKLAT